jgi:hypothetical protein
MSAAACHAALLKNREGTLESRCEKLYRFVWGNNDKRETLKGRTCVVLARGTLNSALIRFIDNSQLEVVSRNALRKEGHGRTHAEVV